MALAVICVALAVRSAAGAPAPGPAASRFLPLPATFGAGWATPTEPVALIPSNAFQDGALAFYGGPAGARIVLVSLLVAQSQPTAARAWDEAGALFERYRSRLDYDHAKKLDKLPPPPGCALAKRVDGFDPAYGFPVGITLCKADPGLVLLAVVSGDLNRQVGYPAADSVVVASLNAGRQTGAIATPAR